jgi:amino acid transporter
MSFVGFVILVFLVLLLVWIFVKLAALPGQTALERGHPQAEAINVLGWVGLLLGVAPWLVALVWAYMKPAAVQQGSSDAQVSSN